MPSLSLPHKVIAAPPDPAPLRRYAAGRAETAAVGALLALCFALHLLLARHLAGIAAFDQYNLFFDADSNQFLGAVEHGWSDIRTLHPGFQLLLNGPVRALDHLAAQAGLARAGALRAAAPLLLAPLCGLLGGGFWWRACVEAGLAPALRLGGLLLLQCSFSQVIFTTIPESYPLSGMLYCVLLWAAVRAQRRPASLERRPVQAAWLALALAMSAVTVTNGFVCVAVWALSRGRRIAWRRRALAALGAAAIVAASIYAVRALDSVAYSLPLPTPGAMLAETGHTGLTPAYTAPSSPQRVKELPALVLAGLLAPRAAVVRNPSAEYHANRYRFGFSFSATAASAPRLALGWLLALAGLYAAWPALAGSTLARAVGAVFLLNAALHTVWGTEVFLYSQHWQAFLLFAIVRPLQALGRRGAALLLGLTLALGANNAWRLADMLAVIHANGNGRLPAAALMQVERGEAKPAKAAPER